MSEEKCFNKYCYNTDMGESIYCKTCEEVPCSIANKSDVEALANKVLMKTTEKLFEEVQDNFYDVIREDLEDHHRNFSKNIMQEAINLIKGKQWAKYSNVFDAKDIRAEIYKSNKESIDKMITEEVVNEGIDKYLGLFVTEKYYSNIRNKGIEDGMSKWVYKNYKDTKFKGIIDNKFTKENEKLRKEKEILLERLEKIKQC